MKLSIGKIKTLDTILEENGVSYIDFKCEILDHIASDIENKMQETESSFEETIEPVLGKWEGQLAKISSYKIYTTHFKLLEANNNILQTT